MGGKDKIDRDRFPQKKGRYKSEKKKENIMIRKKERKKEVRYGLKEKRKNERKKEVKERKKERS